MTVHFNWKGGGKCPGNNPRFKYALCKAQEKKTTFWGNDAGRNHFNCQDDNGCWTLLRSSQCGLREGFPVLAMRDEFVSDQLPLNTARKAR